MKQKLLINWAYYNPVGHLFEALQHARGYYAANHHAVDVYLLVNAASPTALVEACPWIAGVYSIDFADVVAHGEQAASLRAIPQEWEYIITDPRVRAEALRPGWDEDDLIATQAVVQSYLRATEWSGFSRGWECTWNTTGLLGTDDPLPYAANARFTLPLPHDAQAFVQRYHHDGPMICLLPGGSGGIAQSPSLELWAEMLRALATALPNLRVCVTGISRRIGGQTFTRDFSPTAIDELAQRLPFVTNCFDIGLWNQVALISASDILLAPHTGFAFTSQFVGTLWLALSGCPWPEYIFNGIPFYSVIPNCASYPAEGHTERECNQWLARGEKARCMEDEQLRARIPDLLQGAHFLLNPAVTYEQAIARHVANLRRQNRDMNQFRFFLS